MSLKTWCLLSLSVFLFLSITPTESKVVQSMQECEGFLLQEVPLNIPGILENSIIQNRDRYKRNKERRTAQNVDDRASYHQEETHVKRLQQKKRTSPLNYKERLFVLTKARLTYYDGKAEKKCRRGSIDLSRIRCVEIVKNGGGIIPCQNKYPFQRRPAPPLPFAPGDDDIDGDFDDDDEEEEEAVVALYDFPGTEPHDLSLVKGDEYVILEKCDVNWYKARNQNGEEGYIPSNYVTEKKSGNLVQFAWYSKQVNRNKAEELLRKEDKEGAFIVRDSSTPGAYTVSLYTKSVAG
ncbi:hypothetical protein Q8A73_012765 [Channa argus]|nr:hypothetical protein Q8A73_012765 [Channa argus]